MHPVLFRLPLPAWSVPLFPMLLAVAALGVVVLWLGRRYAAADLRWMGGAVAIASSVGALSLRGRAYEIGTLPFYSYGVLLCLSLAVGWFLTLGLAERDGLERERMANCYFVTALAALVGSRLLYVATNPGEFHAALDLVAVRRGGLVAYGGFLGGFLASALFLRRSALPLLPWADVAVPSLAAGVFVTRIGCWLFGCDFGTPLPAGAPGWLVRLGTFPRWAEGVVADTSGSPAWVQHVEARGLSPDSAASLPVHPTQLYESLAGLMLLVLLLRLRRRRRFPGAQFLVFTIGYGVSRFAIEVLRDDPERGVFGPYFERHVALALCLAAFAAAFGHGPARAVVGRRWRLAFTALAFAPAAVAYLALRPRSFETATTVQLSTSQWLALVTVVAAALSWSTVERWAGPKPPATATPSAGG